MSSVRGHSSALEGKTQKQAWYQAIHFYCGRDMSEQLHTAAVGTILSPKWKLKAVKNKWVSGSFAKCNKNPATTGV